MVFFKKGGEGIHGTVRWAGEYSTKENNIPFPAVGIETVSYLYKISIKFYSYFFYSSGCESVSHRVGVLPSSKKPHIRSR